MTACPFRLCTSQVTMAIEKADPSPMPNGLMRVPQHPLGGHEDFGMCPGSLLYVPLSRYDADQLEEQAKSIERMIEDRTKRADKPDGPKLHGDWRDLFKAPEPYRPGREPRPDTNPYWFRNSERQGPYDGYGGGQTAPPTLPQVLLPPVSPVREPTGLIGPTTPLTGGNTGVSTVEGVKAIISAAGEICAQASQELFRIEGEVGKALELLNQVRETSIDPMGAPQVSVAIEQIGDANASLRAAIELGQTYKAGM